MCVEHLAVDTPLLLILLCGLQIFEGQILHCWGLMLMLYSEVFTVPAQFLEQPVLQAL